MHKHPRLVFIVYILYTAFKELSSGAHLLCQNRDYHYNALHKQERRRRPEQKLSETAFKRDVLFKPYNFLFRLLQLYSYLFCRLVNLFLKIGYSQLNRPCRSRLNFLRYLLRHFRLIDCQSFEPSRHALDVLFQAVHELCVVLC